MLSFSIQSKFYNKNYHRYGIKEYRKHGEAGSIDEEAVKVERKRLAVILAEYEKKDQWTFDETGLLGA